MSPSPVKAPPYKLFLREAAQAFISESKRNLSDQERAALETHIQQLLDDEQSQVVGHEVLDDVTYFHARFGRLVVVYTVNRDAGEVVIELMRFSAYVVQEPVSFWERVRRFKLAAGTMATLLKALGALGGLWFAVTETWRCLVH